MNRISPRQVLNPLIDARASKIEDPIEKLRFLRHSDRRVGQVETVLGRPRYWWLRNRKLWLAVFFALLVPSLTLFRPATPLAPAAEFVPPAPAVPRSFAESPLEKVWLVETKGGVETWSNGLHIETRYATTNRPREYYVWNRNLPASSLTQLPSKQAAGIVFHTTESTLEDLVEHKTSRLKLLGESLVQFAREEKAYHYVIDRFGRVFRVVAESDAANHAGKSIWADSKWAYIQLNESFLAVSFETQTRRGDEPPVVSQAQIDAGRLLTRMLRARYEIAATNCVTHAQVSVNTSNFLIGYHTDWAGNFPFEEIGLPDNYAQPLGSLQLFGFSYDNTFFAATGTRMWKGLGSSEDLIRAEAKEKSLSIAQLRTQLRNNYRRLSALLPENNSPMAEKTIADSERSQ
ncbi:N-acetylmuramoyl-L-alanine amidase [Bryobacter aggregatus]|uniref:peptidoglycan recognition protein family protein n=1 Tax=Bryobacter aggregatus TaxID=360054 RepID=UPI0004E1289B|nr:peptidoglycan recognition family protein [Bryobacter aggregatus]